MRTRKTILVLVVSGALCWFAVDRYRTSVACKKRGMALANREETLKRRAHDSLKIGTKRTDVILFFTENDIPLSFDQFGASGIITTSGCAPFGCGADSAIIGVRVELDGEGNVKSEPIVS
jgi:hypothetical protein